MKSTLTLIDISFELPNGTVLFQEISFSLSARVTALVGANGTGKTTLAKIMAGELTPTSGRVLKNSSVSLFAQRESPHPVTLNEYLLDTSEQWSLLKSQLLQNIDGEKLCAQLSGGEWMRVRLAKHLAGGFVILDEPTNDLDREGREIVMKFVRETPHQVLLISHDRELLELSEEIIELSSHGISKFTGNWREFELSKEAEQKRLNRDLEVAKRERDRILTVRKEQVERQEKRERRGTRVARKGGMPRILAGTLKGRAQNTTGKIDVLTSERAREAVKIAYEAYEAVKVDPIMYADLLGGPVHPNKLIAEAINFNVRFKNLLYPKALNFCWRGNIRLALRGPNGSGKSTLIKAILGHALPIEGELKTGDLRILYIDQKNESLIEEKSILDNVKETNLRGETEIRNDLAKFLFTHDKVFQKVSTLSGGERLRANLAKGFLANDKPELLILDEPTNNLDLKNILFLENLIREFRGALIIVSHDETFLKNCRVEKVFEIVES